MRKVRKLFGINIRYLEYEPETDKYGGDIYYKWADALQHVTTNYSQIVTDKEFLVPDLLMKKLEFLENNIDYGAVSGTYCHIELKNEKIRLLPLHYNKKSKIFGSQSNSIDRVKGVCDGVNPLIGCTSLFRTEILKKIYQPILQKNINDCRFGEYSVGILTPIYTKVAEFNDDTYVYRDVIRKNTSESSSKRYPSLTQYISDGVYDMFYDQFETYVSNELGSSDLVKKYVQKYMLSDPFLYKPKLYTSLPFSIDKIWSKLPVDIKNIICICIKSHMRYTKYLPVSKIRSNEKNILDIIESTQKKCSLDLPII